MSAVFRNIKALIEFSVGDSSSEEPPSYTVRNRRKREENNSKAKLPPRSLSYDSTSKDNSPAMLSRASSVPVKMTRYRTCKVPYAERPRPNLKRSCPTVDTIRVHQMLPVALDPGQLSS